MGDEYRVGIIGCGWVGTNRHLPSYTRDSRTNVVAVYDHNLEKAQTVCEQEGIPRAFDDVEEFVDLELDIVSVCTPPWTHPKLTITALEAGSHVLSEKPMATTVDEAEQMVAAAERTGNSLGIVHNFLFSRSMLKARRQVENGAVGDIKTVMGVQTSSPNRHLPTWYPRLPGGLFYDESPHLLYLTEHFLGPLDVEHVSIQHDPDAVQSVQMVDASFRGEDGTLGTLNMLFDAPLSEWQFTIVGTEKILIADIFRDILLSFDGEDAHDIRDVVGTSLNAMIQELAGMAATGVEQLRSNQLFGMGRLVSEFVDALDDGSAPPVSGDDGLRVMEAMHGILDEASFDHE